MTTTPFVTHAFIAGALAPAFHGRVDLDKYDLGVAQAENFYIDFRGGLKSRPGTKFCGELPEGSRLFEFRLRKDQDSIIVVVSNGEMRFMQSESFLLASGGGTLVLTSPYATADLSELRAHQVEAQMFLTHPDYPPQRLLLSPNEDPIFSLAPVNFNRRLNYGETYPNLTEAEAAAREAALVTALENNFNLTATFVTGTGQASVVYAISAVDANGVETLSASPQILSGIKNYAVEQGSVIFAWDPVVGVEYYRLYRSIITSDAELDYTQPLGLIAETRGNRFVDTNTSPDFTITPPRRFNPFANGSILEVEVTAQGTGYVKDTAVSFTSANGTGAIAYPSVVDGKVRSIEVISGGQGYLDTDTIVISDAAAGTGATARIVSVSPPSGNNPRVATKFQQHGVFAGTDNVPSGLWGSRRGTLTNFDTGDNPTAQDSYFYTVESTPVDPIEHLIPIRDGMLIFHPKGIERLRAEEGRAVTALSALVEKQASLGASRVTPLIVNDDVIFSLQQSTAMYSLQFTFFQNSYTPQDISVLASHYFSLGNAINSMAWQEEPDKLLWVTQEDGHALSLTYMKEQEIAAWARHSTDGKFIEAITVNEPNNPRIYFSVEREIDGETKYYLECFVKRDAEALSDFWCVDAGLSLNSETPVTTVSGLTHLEGKEVVALVDGDAVTELVVQDGKVALPFEGKKIIIGLPYECLAETLPLASPQVQADGRKKRVVGTAVRLQETRGLEIGTSLSRMYEMKDRGYEDLGVPTALRSDNSFVWHAARWERDARLFMRQRYPLPATILGLVTETEIGT